MPASSPSGRNDGGCGTLTLYPAEGRAELEHRDWYQDAVALDTKPAQLPRGLLRRQTGLGVRSLTAEFDGYGDSGQIENWSVEPESLTLDTELEGKLEAFLLDRLPGGWEINEGAYGSFTIVLPEGRVLVEASSRVDKASDAQLTRWRWRK